MGWFAADSQKDLLSGERGAIGVFCSQLKKVLVNGGVVGEFGVKCRGQNVSLLHQGGFAGEFGENVYAGANTLKDWPANEDHFERVFF